MVDHDRIAAALAVFEAENYRLDPSRSPQERRLAAMEKAVAAAGAEPRIAAPDAADEVGGWIVGNGTGFRWRTWKDGLPDWTDDRSEATRYARSQDAEAAHAEDEDAFIVVEYRPPSARFDLVAHLARQKAFSERTFGPGARTKGVIDHIRKELTEIEADPADIMEWVDVVILAFDGAWRAGWEPEAIVKAIVAKQERNEQRGWPDWRTSDPDKAIEHIREEGHV